MTPLLDIRDLHVAYDGVPVLHGVSLSLVEGEAAVLLGANGAGKSTLLRALLGLLTAQRGMVSFAGSDLARLSTERRARLGIGYVPEGRRVFPGLSVRENLDVASFLPGSARAGDRERIFDLFPALREKENERAWRLSGGQQQMLALGRALMGRPRLLLLDEPSLGLAPRVAEDVFAAIREIAARGTTVLVAEQSVQRAESLADRRILLKLGRIVA